MALARVSCTRVNWCSTHRHTASKMCLCRSATSTLPRLVDKIGDWPSLFDECLLYPFQTTNVRAAPPSSTAAATSQTRSSCESNSSPVLLPTYERSEMSPGSHTLRTPGSERAVKVGQTVIKERDSPQTMDRRGGRRYSCTQTR